MKANQLFIASIFLALIPLLNSCGDDSKSGDPTPPGPQVPVTADVTYTVDLRDLIEMLGVEVEYTDKDGKAVKETVTTRQWSKTIQKVSVPYTAKFKINFTKKEDFVPEKDVYEVAGRNMLSISYVRSDKGAGHNLGDGILTLGKDKVEALIARYLAGIREKVLEVPAK